MSSPADILQQAAELFKERSAQYGDNYLKIGSVLQALFPDGMRIATADADVRHEWNRAHLFMMILVKVTRYAENWDKGGHQDSLRDLAVYAAMLESVDAMKDKKHE
jgi:hypothetical protein